MQEKLLSDNPHTTFIIAHRLSTVMKADEILVINQGEIVERGNHQKLIKEKGLYADLFKIQSGAFLLADEGKNSTL
jgi:ABC-type transport system involved in Fe-S cluster assembly fused permease/ATPase subunit